MKPQYKYFFIINIKCPYNPYNNKIHIKQNNKYLNIIFNTIVLLTLKNLYVYYIYLYVNIKNTLKLTNF